MEEGGRGREEREGGEREVVEGREQCVLMKREGMREEHVFMMRNRTGRA